jgi:hypothetical protein
MQVKNGLFVVALALVVGSVGCAEQKAAPEVKPVTFKEVGPILTANCMPCHDGPKPGHGLTLSSYAAAIRGDKEGKVIIAGDPEGSRLYTVLHGKPQAMPPAGPIDKASIETIRQWIEGGAKEQ